MDTIDLNISFQTCECTIALEDIHMLIGVKVNGPTYIQWASIEPSMVAEECHGFIVVHSYYFQICFEVLVRVVQWLT